MKNMMGEGLKDIDNLDVAIEQDVGGKKLVADKRNLMHKTDSKEHKGSKVWDDVKN